MKDYNLLRRVLIRNLDKIHYTQFPIEVQLIRVKYEFTLQEIADTLFEVSPTTYNRIKNEMIKDSKLYNGGSK
jgi:hypothetical protein